MAGPDAARGGDGAGWRRKVTYPAPEETGKQLQSGHGDHRHQLPTGDGDSRRSPSAQSMSSWFRYEESDRENLN